MRTISAAQFPAFWQPFSISIIIEALFVMSLVWINFQSPRRVRASNYHRKNVETWISLTLHYITSPQVTRIAKYAQLWQPKTISAPLSRSGQSGRDLLQMLNVPCNSISNISEVRFSNHGSEATTLAVVCHSSMGRIT
jgi:hypothetical protein